MNEYSIVSSSQDASTDLSAWEFYGSQNSVDFELLDIRWNVRFEYRNQRMTFPLNNNPKNYRYFRIRFCSLFWTCVTT